MHFFQSLIGWRDSYFSPELIWKKKWLYHSTSVQNIMKVRRNFFPFFSILLFLLELILHLAGIKYFQKTSSHENKYNQCGFVINQVEIRSKKDQEAQGAIIKNENFK